jgi:hypothetical protein
VHIVSDGDSAFVARPRDLDSVLWKLSKIDSNDTDQIAIRMWRRAQEYDRRLASVPRKIKLALAGLGMRASFRQAIQGSSQHLKKAEMMLPDRAQLRT